MTLSGRLLVASPHLVDPNFHRTVVLLLDHDDEGAFGVVLNRPLPVEVDAVLPGWQDVVSHPDGLFQGGPVGLDGALGIAVPAADPARRRPRSATAPAPTPPASEVPPTASPTAPAEDRSSDAWPGDRSSDAWPGDGSSDPLPGDRSSDPLPGDLSSSPLAGALPPGGARGDGTAQPPDDHLVDRFTGLFGLVDLDADPSTVVGRFTGLRIFAGHSGWGGGQLEEEIGEGAWFVVPSEPTDVFTADPETLWSRVLHRQGGDLAMLAHYPPDLRLN